MFIPDPSSPVHHRKFISTGRHDRYRENEHYQLQVEVIIPVVSDSEQVLLDLVVETPAIHDPALVSQEKSRISFCEPDAVFFLLLLCTEIKVEKQNEDYQVKLLQ